MEIFHPWVRWEGLGSGFESLSSVVAAAIAAATCVWKSGISPFGTEVEQQGFRTAWDRTSQKFQGVGLKLKAFILTFQDLASHLCHKFMRVAG